MKILFLSAASSVHTVKWVNSLVARGHDVHLVYNAGHNPRNGTLAKEVRLYCMKYGGSKGYYLNAGQLRKIKREINPDIINVHYASGYGTLARRADIGPILLSIWGSDVYEFPYQSRIKRRILMKNVEYASKLASTSYCMAKQLRRVMHREELKVAITPFGVDLTVFAPGKYDGNKTDEIVIGTIKALEPHYGIEKLIKAVKMVSVHLKEMGDHEIDNRLRVEIYGTGSLKGELTHLIEELCLEDKVFLKGKVNHEEVPATLSRFTMFCAASRHESFGVAVVEAMAMKVPVVVTDAEGLKEVVQNRETGLVVDRESDVRLAEAIEELLLSPEKRHQYAASARMRVEAVYDWEHNVDEMEEIYRSLAKEKEK